MATRTVTEHVATAPPQARARRLDDLLGRPVAFAATAAILLALFGWTFVANPERVAPTKDPAYYTWRTEALISEDPATLLDIEGAFGMFAGGYRVAAPVIGGFLRQIGGIHPLKTTVFLMVALPVLIALLLGAFGYRHRRDPLIFHSVALGTGSLLLTPPFVGYLDNVLCLFFIAAALPFLSQTRDRWPPRIAVGTFLLLSGLTHPTTLAIFCVVLGAMAVVRLMFRRFDLASVLRDDGPMLATAFVSVIATYLVWKVGIWGPSASLGEAALPPPYGSDFFVDRLVLWVKAMRPALNGPLFAIGAVGLLVAGKRAAEDDLARVSIVWLAPLGGLFGFLAGLTYPYYRFFNTTLAWILLVGLGIYFVGRYFLAARRPAWVAYLVLAALGVLVATNFATGFRLSGWNNPTGGWMPRDVRAQLENLRLSIAARFDEDRPVVFVIDDEDHSFQIWGFTKLSGNTSRYGLPRGQIDRGYLYLGSLDNYLRGEPTLVGEETYDKLSPALLEDANEGIRRAGQEPLIVVASAFNQSGENASIVSGQEAADPGVLMTGLPPDIREPEVWVLNDSGITTGDGLHLTTTPASTTAPPSGLHALVVLVAVVVLLLPGALCLFYFLPDATAADALPVSCALAVGLIAVIGTVALAVARAPLSGGLAWACVAICWAVGVVLAGRAGLRLVPQPAR